MLVHRCDGGAAGGGKPEPCPTGLAADSWPKASALPIVRSIEAIQAAVGLEAFTDLNRKFACWRKDQRASTGRSRWRARLEEFLQKRKTEGGRFARSRLRYAENVAACEKGWNGVHLDGCGLEVFLSCERTLKRLGYAKQRKGRMSQKNSLSTKTAFNARRGGLPSSTHIWS